MSAHAYVCVRVSYVYVVRNGTGVRTYVRTRSFVHLNGVVVIDLGGLFTGRRVGVVACLIRGWGAHGDTTVSSTHQNSKILTCRGFVRRRTVRTGSLTWEDCSQAGGWVLWSV